MRFAGGSAASPANGFNGQVFIMLKDFRATYKYALRGSIVTMFTDACDVAVYNA